VSNSSKYKGIDPTSTDPDVIKKISLWKQNDMLAGYVALSQDGSTGVDIIEETISNDFSMGVQYLVFKKLDRLYKPKDLTSKIIMKAEVEAVQFFKLADDFRMKVNHVMSQYNHRLTDVELLKSPTC
jgi:hypothetical protein